MTTDDWDWKPPRDWRGLYAVALFVALIVWLAGVLG